MHVPASSAVIARVEATIAQRLADAHERALASVLATIDDPQARLGEKAKALEVLGEQRALAEGRATANVAVNGMGQQATAGFTEEENETIAGFIQRWTEAGLNGEAFIILPRNWWMQSEERFVEQMRRDYRDAVAEREANG